MPTQTWLARLSANKLKGNLFRSISGIMETYKPVCQGIAYFYNRLKCIATI
jgi:hypothetical protein